MTIPDSISSMVFHMRHPWLWTVAIEVMAVVTLMLMINRSEAYAGVAFASCACIAFVGAMPLIRHEANRPHYILAITGAVISQLWCQLVVLPLAFLLVCWLPYAALLPLMGRKWCLVAELWATAAVWLVALNVI